jgi:hypothetical protein
MFLLTVAFVGYSGYSFTWQWFTRLDDFALGVPGQAAPSSALHTELRQRQLLAVLVRGHAKRTGAGGPAAKSDASGDGDADARDVDATDIDLSVIDSMYERAMAGPFCGPLLRLFLADYIRYAAASARLLWRPAARSQVTHHPV